MARAIGAIAPLRISAESEELRSRILSELGPLPQPVEIHVAPSNDVWVRDHGPIGVHIEQQVQLQKFGFDGWGGKYPAQADNALALEWDKRGLWEQTGPLVEQGWVLEGGAIDTDGQGTLLATCSSVLDPKRNPGLNRADIETRLRAALGVERILWLEHGGLLGDDTDGHVDTLARFVSPEHIVYQSCADPCLPNAPALQALEQELRGLRQANGQSYRLTALPHTLAAHESEDGPLPTSYANFLLLNGHLLLPQYQDPADAIALATLQAACPEFQIIPVDCSALVAQYGSLHCATMNIPAPPV